MLSQHEDAIGYEAERQPPCGCGCRVVFVGLRREVSAISMTGAAVFGGLALMLMAGGAPWFVTALAALLAAGGLANMSRRDRDRYRLYRCPGCKRVRKVPI